MPKINLIQAKSILTKTNLPGADWVINPYNGCLFGCLYCYAAQIARWKHPGETWGTYLDVKINASEILTLELSKLSKKLKTENFGSIFFSSVTDPYVSLEAKYQLTRKCLQVLVNFGYQGSLSLQTKSALVIRDIDLLKKIKKVSVGFTITSLNDQVACFLEVKAPPISQRLMALKKLHQAGISTYAFIGPILPHFINNLAKINKLLDKLNEVGVGEVWFEHLNLTPLVKSRLYHYLQHQSPGLIADFDQANTKAYRTKLDSLIHQAVKSRKLKMGLAKVIHHRKLPKKK